MNHLRMVLVMKCFDRLPREQREWIANLHFSLHDDHILKGTDDVASAKGFVERGVIYFRPGNGQN